ncbi:hypothetical protein GQ44DRAFT_450478 [Phaeosphaeriaceae sp. PMI808]|nr:hypothetical protein GQ44DRAFT_450478 [Phaeosphaeriaceae sp. PMI808]
MVTTSIYTSACVPVTCTLTRIYLPTYYLLTLLTLPFTYIHSYSHAHMHISMYTVKIRYDNTYIPTPPPSTITTTTTPLSPPSSIALFASCAPGLRSLLLHTLRRACLPLVLLPCPSFPPAHHVPCDDDNNNNNDNNIKDNNVGMCKSKSKTLSTTYRASLLLVTHGLYSLPSEDSMSCLGPLRAVDWCDSLGGPSLHRAVRLHQTRQAVIDAFLDSSRTTARTYLCFARSLAEHAC